VLNPKVPSARPKAARALAGVGLFALGLFACQGPDQYFRNGAAPGTGGSPVSTGGTGVGNSGDGGSAPGTGGIIGTGGILGTGGLMATGGVKGTGGVTGMAGRGMGGAMGGGGVLGTGGLRASGGAGGGVGGGTAGTHGGGGAGGAGGATMATCTGSKLCVQLNCQSPNTQTIEFQLDVLNNSNTGLALSDVTVRYWFTMGTVPDMPGVEIDYWMYDKANITTKFAAVSPAVSGANEYIEIGFKTAAPMLPLFTDSTNIQMRFHTASYSSMFDPMPTADYSYQKCTPPNTTVVNPAPTVTGYIKGTLAWGTEPM
jgi:hypothetical protein